MSQRKRKDLKMLPERKKEKKKEREINGQWNVTLEKKAMKNLQSVKCDSKEKKRNREIYMNKKDERKGEREAG